MTFVKLKVKGQVSSLKGTGINETQALGGISAHPLLMGLCPASRPGKEEARGPSTHSSTKATSDRDL